MHAFQEIHIHSDTYPKHTHAHAYPKHTRVHTHPVITSLVRTLPIKSTLTLFIYTMRGKVPGLGIDVATAARIVEISSGFRLTGLTSTARSRRHSDAVYVSIRIMTTLKL